MSHFLIIQGVCFVSSPATTATHLLVIRLCRVLTDHPLCCKGPSVGPTNVTVEAMLYLKPLASCRSPTALNRPDRLKQCHCLQFVLLYLMNG